MNKKRIMVVGDKSVSNTGFAIYNKRLLEHLYNNPNYEVAEFAGAGLKSEKSMVPWKYYPCIPDKDDKDHDALHSHPQAIKYGQFRWLKAASHFKPNLVICLQDPWDYRFLNFCEFRDCYDYCMSVPVDGDQPKAEWLENCYCADGLIPYTNYGETIFKKRGIESTEVIPMGIDIDVFKPLNKKECRKDLGLPVDGYFYGFVARNQPRKRLPELFRAFRKVLNESKRDDLYLYLHTTYPDIACWNLPALLLEFNIVDKVYLTYKCIETNKAFAGLYQEPFRSSPYTDTLSGRLCSQNAQITPEELNKIYNSLDLYIQCSSNEGLGYPVLEAAAANIDILGINHSAVTEVVNNVGGELIFINNLDRDYNMHMDRATIPTDSLVEKMLNFERKKQNTRDNLIKSDYLWSSQLSKWDKVIEKFGNNSKWENVKIQDCPEIKAEGEMTPQSFIKSIYSGLSSKNSFAALYEIKELFYGAYPDVRGGTPPQITIDKYNSRYEGIRKINEILNKEIEVESWMK